MDIPEHGLTKLVWTDADFAQMSWHDSMLHGFHTDHIDHDYDNYRYDFVFDLDYLTRWVLPATPHVPTAFPTSGGIAAVSEWAHCEVEHVNSRITFWVAPATLAFHNAHTITMSIGSSAGDIEVRDLERTESRLTPNGVMTEYLWMLYLQQGIISLWATSFTQYFRRWPVYQQGQWLTLEERGGVSFAREMDVP